MKQTQSQKPSAATRAQGKAKESPPELLVGYYRVSTKQQGQSGLGLEAQQESVRRFAASRGATIVAEFAEVETGTTKRFRPVLDQAISRTKAIRGRLVLAKLDRLARSVSFTSRLMEEGLKFTACDIPNASEVVVHILAAVAQEEARLISQRTQAALRAFRARGGLLGCSRPDCPLLRPEVQRKGSAAGGRSTQALADKAYGPVMREMIDLYRQLNTYEGVAAELTRRGRLTRNQCRWSKTQVRRVLSRWA